MGQSPSFSWLFCMVCMCIVVFSYFSICPVLADGELCGIFEGKNGQKVECRCYLPLRARYEVVGTKTRFVGAQTRSLNKQFIDTTT